MADPKRVARALQYQQDKPAWWDAVPVADAPGTVRTPTPQEMSWLDRLNELSAGAGKGIESQLEGYKNMVLHPVDTAKQMYQSGKAVVQDPSLLVKGLQAMGERAMGSPQGFGEVVGENINPRNLLRNLARPSIEELTVYHGTPHRFPATERNPLGEFDASKIGTGEGAQVYGHGIYVAEAQDVGDSYRQALTPHKVTADVAQSLANYAIRQRREPEAAIQWLEKERTRYKETPSPETMKQYDDAIAILRQGNVEKVGNLYKADLPDEMIDRMLDWYKPLSEQPKAVREALKKSGLTSYVDEMEQSYFNQLSPAAQTLAQKMINGPDEMIIGTGKGFKNNKIAERNWDELERLAPGVDHNRIHDIRDWYQSKSGADLYSEMSRNGVQDASERLRQMGIPGISYLDAGSRGTAGAQTRNFVIFPGEEKKVKILERK